MRDTTRRLPGDWRGFRSTRRRAGDYKKVIPDWGTSFARRGKSDPRSNVCRPSAITPEFNIEQIVGPPGALQKLGGFH